MKLSISLVFCDCLTFECCCEFPTCWQLMTSLLCLAIALVAQVFKHGPIDVVPPTGGMKAQRELGVVICPCLRRDRSSSG